jgi:predicted metal-dependent phosphotriesterase family hydrolase
MSDVVRSVSGDVELEDGIVLPHEHLLIDYGLLRGEPREPVDDQLRTTLIGAMRALAASGVRAMVDCTPPGYGRYLDLMREVSEASGVTVIAATGSFCEAWAPMPWWVQRASVDELTDWFVRELTEGAGETLLRAGVIKTATGEVMSPLEERVLRAAARAQSRTGCAIVGHTTGGLGPQQLDIYESEGADLTRVLISHVGFEDDPAPYATSIAARGAYVGLDRIGHHHFFPDEHWIALLTHLVDAGYSDQVLLSHDAVTRFSGPAEIGAHTFSDYRYLTTRFLPKLHDAGMDEPLLHALTHRNPRNWLCGPIRKDRP